MSENPRKQHLEWFNDVLRMCCTKAQICTCLQTVSMTAELFLNLGCTTDKETKSIHLESSFMEEIQHEKEDEVASIKKRNSQLGNDDGLDIMLIFFIS